MSVGLSCLALSLPPRDWRVRLWTDALALAVWHCRVTESESLPLARSDSGSLSQLGLTCARSFFANCRAASLATTCPLALVAQVVRSLEA